MTAPEAIVVLALFEPAPGRLDALLDALRVAIPRVHEEAGCDLYCIQVQDTGRVVMVERWATVADLDAHAAGPVVADLDASLVGLLSGPPEVVRLAPVAIGDLQRGAIPAPR